MLEDAIFSWMDQGLSLFRLLHTNQDCAYKNEIVNNGLKWLFRPKIVAS